MLWLAPEALALESSVDELVALLEADESEDDAEDDAEDDEADEADADEDADADADEDADEDEDAADDVDEEDEDDDREPDRMSSAPPPPVLPPRSSPAGSSAPLRLRMTSARLDSRIMGCLFWKNLPFQTCRFRARPKTPVSPPFTGDWDRRLSGIG